SWSMELDEVAQKVTAEFDARSLTVVSVMKEGVESSATLGSFDRSTIEKNIVNDVLEAKKYPTVRFVSTEVKPEGDGFRVRGDLSLHGRTRSIDLVLAPREGKYRSRVRLHQPDFGIKPYTAFLGTLKIQPDLFVELSLSDPRK